VACGVVFGVVGGVVCGVVCVVSGGFVGGVSAVWGVVRFVWGVGCV